MSRGVALVAFAWLLAVGSFAAAGSHDVSEGRHHLRKANALATEGRCDAAIREYTLAYQKLADPVVLFNRAECYRRLGQNAAAAADYQGFLDAVPHAPNRAEVEARLALMQGLPPPAPVAPAPARPAPPPPARPTAPPSVVLPPQDLMPPLPPPMPVAPATPSAEANPASPPPPAPPPPVERPAITVESGVTAPPPPAAEGEAHGHTWVWVALGVLVAGGAVGAYFATRTPGTTPPMTQLGNYQF